MNESERFAAAAIAFAWMHDSYFRKHFWTSICRFEGDPELADKANISVEPYLWADLLITNPTEGRLYVYVVEMKLGAGLADIQNPSKGEFGQPKGYGYLLTQNFAPNATLRYVVLGVSQTLPVEKPPWTLPVLVQQRSWKDLANSLPESAMCKDLPTSLGLLGVGDFPAAEVKDCEWFCEVFRTLGVKTMT